VVRVGLCVEALGRLPFSLVRFFWASKRNERAYQIKFGKLANPKQKMFKHTFNIQYLTVIL
jgi:hypothetical protein